MGATWQNLTETVNTAALDLVPVPGVIPAGGNVSGFVSSMFGWIVEDIQSTIEDVKKTVFPGSQKFPLIVVGIATGAPLAQLTATFASPGNVWERDGSGFPTLTCPVDEIGCYVYSCPQFADPAFASGFSKHVSWPLKTVPK